MERIEVKGGGRRGRLEEAGRNILEEACARTPVRASGGVATAKDACPNRFTGPEGEVSSSAGRKVRCTL